MIETVQTSYESHLVLTRIPSDLQPTQLPDYKRLQRASYKLPTAKLVIVKQSYEIVNEE